MATNAGPAATADDPLVKASTRCGSVAGIPLYVHHTFALWLGFAVLLSPEWSAPAVIYRMLVYGPVLFGTVLVHEIGHCKACERAGGTAKVNDPRPKQRHTHGRTPKIPTPCRFQNDSHAPHAQTQTILLWPLGGLATIHHDAGPKADLVIAAAGPLTHVPMFLFWFLLLLASAGGDASLMPATGNVFVAVCASGAVINISLFCFNLFLPAHPLDGGRILVDVLLWRGCSPRTTAIAALSFSVPVALLLLLHWTFLSYNVMALFVGLWLLYSDYTVIQALQAGVVECHPMFAHLPQTTLTNNPLAANPAGV